MNWTPNSLHVFRFVFYVNGFYNNLTKNFFVQHYMISIDKLKYAVYVYGETTVLYLTIIKKNTKFSLITCCIPFGPVEGHGFI